MSLTHRLTPPPPSYRSRVSSVSHFRPYTSYLIFSQLERQYILQNLFGCMPILSHEEVFDSANHPDIPPLPLRYEGLILQWDWHIPGKTQRRKRKHRKSHGKIGFQELNKRISEAWSVVGDDVRDFCALLSEIEGKKYKTAKKEERARQRKINAMKATFSTANELDFGCYDFDWTVNVDRFPREDFTAETISANYTRRITHNGEAERFAPQGNDGGNLVNCSRHVAYNGEAETFAPRGNDDRNLVNYSRRVTLNGEAETFAPRGNDGRNLVNYSRCVTLNEEAANVAPRGNNDRNVVEVDVSDDEIINIWWSINIENDVFEGRKSFIETEYERFVDLGKMFRAKK